MCGERVWSKSGRAREYAPVSREGRLLRCLKLGRAFRNGGFNCAVEAGEFSVIDGIILDG
jgi:hypothetical protein